MNSSRAITLAVVLVVLGATGLAGRRAAGPLWDRMQAREPALDLKAVEGGLGQGLTLALLGGFRAIVADFLWLANNLAWEQRDLVRSLNLIRLTTAVDPRPLYFWINGARMIAYDMPVWRTGEFAENRPALASAKQKRIDREQAEIALGFLEEALRQHPGNPFLTLEMANIHLRRLGDVARAAELYGAAALLPGAPAYAARIYAELLKRQGRDREALEWLKALYPKLDPRNPYDLTDVVFERIEELEEKLNVPRDSRYRNTKVVY
ncbi:MAG: tetratricopeptide repeat protein [Opitutaceae bacterium]